MATVVKKTTKKQTCWYTTVHFSMAGLNEAARLPILRRLNLYIGYVASETLEWLPFHNPRVASLGLL